MRALMRTAIVSIALLTSMGAGRLSAQTSPDDPRFRVSVNAGFQPTAHSFDSTTTPVVYLEKASIHTPYNVGRGPLFDGGLTCRIGGGLGVGVAASWFSKASDTTVDASLPHPFFFNTPRLISGPAGGLRREELATHLQLVYTIRPVERIDVALTAGPSFFRVKQDFVSNVSFADTYPYDVPVFTAALSQQASSNKTGFNVGADVTMRLSDRLGVGVLARYTKASMVFTVPNSSTTVTTDAGGLQAVGGIRLYF